MMYGLVRTAFPDNSASLVSNRRKDGTLIAAVKRLRLANEGAAREDIQQAIAAMAALNL